MKHVIALPLILCLLNTHAQQRDHKPFKKKPALNKETGRVRIMGTAGHAYNGEMVLACIAKGDFTDSATVLNGKFMIEAAFKEPIRCNFYSRTEIKKTGQYRSFVVLVTRPGDIYLNVNMDSMAGSSVNGMPDTDIYNAYEKATIEAQQSLMNRVEAKYDRHLIDKPDPKHPRYTELMADVRKLKQENKQTTEARLEQLITNNRNGFAALYALWLVRTGLSDDKLRFLFNMLGDDYKNTSYAQQLMEMIRVNQQFAIGKKAPEFEQPDTLGRMVKLSDFRGKYVLIDFWASWCGPCRMENPNVVAAYNKYRNRNFTVLGISLDGPNGKTSWLNAIHKDGLTWTHVSDLRSWNNAVAKQYGVHAVPYNLLIDPGGKIVAKNLRDEELGEKLAQLLGS